MRTKRYSCPNGCRLPNRTKMPKRKENGTYTFGFNDYNFCPVCGSIMPQTMNRLKGFFEVYNLHPKLESALRLLYKSEYTSAAREAFVVVEEQLRKQSGLDLYGRDLAVKALSFEYDSKTASVTVMPLITINDLSTNSKRNEQEGLKFLLMGFFTGQRNLYLHNYIGSGVSNVLSVLLEASFILHLIDGHSVTDKGEWVPSHISYNDIYQNMPRFIDRVQFKRAMKQRRRKVKNNGISGIDKKQWQRRHKE